MKRDAQVGIGNMVMGKRGEGSQLVEQGLPLVINHTLITGARNIAQSECSLFMECSQYGAFAET